MARKDPILDDFNEIDEVALTRADAMFEPVKPP
jgi:hypothetical protein